MSSHFNVLVILLFSFGPMTIAGEGMTSEAQRSRKLSNQDLRVIKFELKEFSDLSDNPAGSEAYNEMFVLAVYLKH
ncbi:hypothetical protein CEXT_40811 [Caerostris extrusa]|uniref:Uncharacterized protein n=1 Tax=Caerostris extrusa TaxID=172846 RepID=A0AAV4Y748_CAEEX|nr:hypothetical protein CEXT_40811 [Caerostris extrusa]